MKPLRTSAFTDNPKSRIPRSMFDLSHEVLFTAFQQTLYPILVLDCIPGDVWTIGQTAVIRMQPLVAPILTGIRLKTEYFFVPYRLLWDQFQDFYTKGRLGTTELTTPKFNPADYADPAQVVQEGSLWDFLGFPAGVVPPPSALPNDFLRRAYYFIWNQWYRDQTLQDEYDPFDLTQNNPLLQRNWSKDYFTSALPFRQRGIPVALPVVGTGNAQFSFTPYDSAPLSPSMRLMASGFLKDANDPRMFLSTVYNGAYDGGTVGERTQAAQNMNNVFTAANTISGADFTATDISDFRYIFAIQSWQEKNARGGSRFTEFLVEQFDVFNGDDRLQLPEYLGGSSLPIVISEVLQTSNTDAQPTPQGTLAGHGIGVANGGIGSYRVTEPGCIMGLFSLTAEALYQQGINRQFSQDTTFDYPFPSFVGLSEQAILNKEIFVTDVSADPTGAINNAVFGFTGFYNHYRFVPSRVSGEMRSTFAYWTQSRIFAAQPTLDSAFISARPRPDIFADQVDPGFIVRFGNNLTAIRPLPFMPQPITLGGV